MKKWSFFLIGLHAVFVFSAIGALLHTVSGDERGIAYAALCLAVAAHIRIERSK